VANVTVLGFPSNNFGLEEPSKNHEILNTIKYVRPGDGYEPNFPLFEKIEVNGENEEPLFTYMKSKCPPPIKEFWSREKLYYDPVRPNDIAWNFHKFLIDQSGRVFRRYNHGMEPYSPIIAKDIRYLLENNSL